MIGRIFRNTFKNIRRAPYQALAAILILTLTLFTTQVFILIFFGSQEILQYFETRPQVTAFFTDEVNESTIQQLKTQFEAQAYVSSVTYVSKQQALEIYREQNQSDPLLLEMVTADILPASLEVSATSVDDLPPIKTELDGVVGVEEVVFQQDVVDALKRWTVGLKSAGVIIVGVLAFTALLVITIIISLKASSKRQEIATMKLLGATPLYINGPFVFEGALYGITSALISWIITYILLLYATPSLLAFFGEIPLLPVSPLFMLSILGIASAVAAFIGMVSGAFSSRRFGH